ncbi:MAG: CoA ester lyase [Dehalococcoidia bacterium]|nr:CoA ester lyase [Dehalococcoidia bacterium]
MARLIRSIMFSPGNLPEIITKVPRAGADVSIICWEDGTPVDAKEEARSLTTAAVQELRGQGWQERLFIRTNHPTSEWFEDDVAAVATGPYDGIVLPKLGSAADVAALHAAALVGMDASRVASLDVILGIESGLGVLNLKEIVGEASNAIGVYFGAEDYATSIGAKRSTSNVEVAYPRALVAMVARSYGLSCFDQGTLDFRDEERFERECAEARSYGYTGKICFHPRQVELTNRLFMPTDAEIEWARRLLSEYEAALAEGHATPAIDGQMIDGPLVKRAEATLALAGD